MIDHVYLVDDDLRLIDDAAIVTLERKLDLVLPKGYHHFMTTLGIGTYCDQIFVFPPDAIEKHTAVFRKNLCEHFFWDPGLDVLPRTQIEQSLHIAISLDGDQLIYHPASEHGVYVLPRHDDTIYWLPHDFAEPHAMAQYFRIAISKTNLQILRASLRPLVH